MKIYISYTQDDIKRFEIEPTLLFLEKQREIERVFYGERDCFKGIHTAEYMITSIKACDVFLVFCSPFSKISHIVQQEIGMAMAFEKKIIPIYLNFEEDLDTTLKTKHGIRFETSDLENYFDSLFVNLTGHKLITENIEQMELYWLRTKANDLKGEVVIKVMIAGEGETGKSTFLFRAISDKFVETLKMTIGIDFAIFNYPLDGILYSIQLWDLGGQERFRFALPSYFPGASAALIFYDSTRRGTLTYLSEWVELCRKKNSHTPIILIGSKADLDSKVSDGEVKDQMQRLNITDHLRISSKTNGNIAKVFELVIKRAIESNEKIREKVEEIKAKKNKSK